MALSDDRIAEMMRDTWGCASIAPRHAAAFARAIEAEVRMQDDALIRQLVEALEGSISMTMGKAEQRNTALIAGRAWLEHSTATPSSRRRSWRKRSPPSCNPCSP